MSIPDQQAARVQSLEFPKHQLATDLTNGLMTYAWLETFLSWLAVDALAGEFAINVNLVHL